MAKNKTKKFGKFVALFALIFAPVAAVSASTVQVSVNIAPVASIEVESERDGDNLKYTATVTTNSINGFDVYATSTDSDDWTLIKSVTHYPSDEERVVTATSTDKELKFTVIPRV